MLKKSIFSVVCGVLALSTMGCEDKKPQPDQHHDAAPQNPAQAALPADFDADKYLKLNPDVDAHYGHLPAQERQEAAKNHYLNHGIAENRNFK